MPQHSQIQSADCHEPKHITDAVMADAGKVITPSDSSDGVSELRLLDLTEIAGLVAALAAKVSLTGTETLTNKRISPRVVTLTDAATIAVNADTTDVGVVTLTDNRTLGNPSGTPTVGQRLIIRVRQDATGSRTLAYDTKYRFSGASAPTLTVTAAKTDYLTFIYHASDDKWDCLTSVLNF